MKYDIDKARIFVAIREINKGGPLTKLLEDSRVGDPWPDDYPNPAEIKMALQIISAFGKTVIAMMDDQILMQRIGDHLRFEIKNLYPFKRAELTQLILD
jgi:hypothetical protein